MPNDQDKPDDSQQSSDAPQSQSNRPRTEPIRLMPDGFGRLDVLRAKREMRFQEEEVAEVEERVARAGEETPAAPLNTLPPQPGDEVVVAEDGSAPWLGREKTMLPQSKPDVDPAWLGREQTMVPQSRPQAKAADWTGTEQTIVGAAAPTPSEEASPEWIGREKTMVPQSKPEGEWTGNEKTVVGMDTGGAWLGREKTMIGIDGTAPAKPSGETSHGAANRKPTSPTLIDGWHLKGRKGPLTGKSVGDYDVGGILGEGGMGTVYRARQISLKRRVALKVLPSNLSGDARLRERFEQEARTASLINSLHVVQVFAAGQADDIVYFAMEFVEGTDLAAVIDDKAAKKEMFTPEEAASYIIQAGKGLAEAGRHGIVHRDIKPPNLMITAHGVVKIADFGISKVAGEHSLTMTGTAVGTPAYVSPEQGRGDTVDARSDLYSLGVVFYELLVGQKPFDGATANALIYQHNYAEPKLLKELRADLPDEYQAVALKCLQKDPAKRYQSADELVQDLERIRAGSAPMTAMMEVFGTGADEAMRRLGIKQRRILPYLIAAALFLALAGGIGAWWMDQRGEIARLRVALAPLGESKPIYAGAGDDLDVLAGYVGDDDGDVARWRQKFTRVEDLGKRLARLDDAAVLDASTRVECERDLGDYA
nr:serine/threonine protein kinase [Planctomycetota bacterium]